MHIYCLGLNHLTAPLGLREKLAFSEGDARTALAYLRTASSFTCIQEMVIVSTCNRMELYFTGDISDPDYIEVETFLSTLRNVAVSEFHHRLYRYVDEAAFDHLGKVTTGLDSQVLGEPQILGQVTRWLELSQESNASGAVLSKMFRAAIHAGKRARAETGIARNPASVSSLAAALASKEVKDLPSAQVVVVGAGEMAELAVESLRKRGVTQIMVINRTLNRGQALAKRWGARAGTFKQLEASLQKTDILISSTSASQTIITAPMMEEIMRKRDGRPIVLIDIAVPRNIEPSAGLIPGVKLFDIDTLESRVESILVERCAAIPRVESILQEEKREFKQYLQILDMLPLITGLRKQAERIRQQELERTFHHMPDLTDLQRTRIEAMTRALVKKLLASPTERLRSMASCPQSAEFASLASNLFDLPDGSGYSARAESEFAGLTVSVAESETHE